MKMQPIRLANALAISQGILGVVCAVLSYAAPDFVVRVVKSLPHTLDLTPLVKERPTFDAGMFFFGLISWMILAWVTGWLLGVTYNGLAAKEPNYNEQLKTRTQ